MILLARRAGALGEWPSRTGPVGDWLKHLVKCATHAPTVSRVQSGTHTGKNSRTTPQPPTEPNGRVAPLAVVHEPLYAQLRAKKTREKSQITEITDFLQNPTFFTDPKTQTLLGVGEGFFERWLSFATDGEGNSNCEAAEGKLVSLREPMFVLVREVVFERSDVFGR